MRRSARLSRASSEPEDEQEVPVIEAPVPRKPKRLTLKNRPRPEYPYELINKMPVTEHKPDPAELSNPLSEEQSKTLAMSVHASRNAYLSGTMFNTTTSRKQQSRIEQPETAVPFTRLTKLCDSVFIMGLHRFVGKLYTCREDDAPPVRARPPPTAAPDQQAVIRKLQQMAREDPALAKLMAEVASGKASPQLVAEFQKYIQKAKELVPGQGAPTTPAAPAPAPATPAPTTTSTPPPSDSKAPTTAPNSAPNAPATPASSLAIEFNDNPNDRFLIPRDSIIELMPNTDILVSFLHVERGFYTPFTITIKQVPARFFSIVEQCFEPPPLARKHMTEKMHKYTRSKSYYVWYQVDKTDALVLDDVRKSHPPYFAVAQPKRVQKARRTSKYPTPRPTPRSNPLSVQKAPSPPPTVEEPPRPRLNLPDINSIKLPQGAMPPLPRSLQGILPQR